MPSVELQIAFDRPSRTYLSGERVTGTVIARPGEDVRCRGLSLEYFWRTHGRGNTDQGKSSKTMLFQGQWRAGKVERYRFQFPCPPGPPSYRGHYVNVDHYVRATARVSFVFDPHAQEEFTVLPAAGRAGVHLPARYELTKPEKTSPTAGIISIVLLAMGIFFFMPLGLILIPAGLIVGYVWGRRWFAEQKIGEVTVDWPSDVVFSGSSAPLEVEFTPKRATTLNGITATLIGEEQSEAGGGTDKNTETLAFYSHPTRVAKREELAQGQQARFSVDIPIPPTRAFSFVAASNKVVWKLKLQIDIPLWPDWIESRELIVVPSAQEIVDAQIVSEPSEAEALLLGSEHFQEQTEAEPALPKAPADRRHATEAGEGLVTADPVAVAVVAEPPPEPLEIGSGGDNRELVGHIRRIDQADRFGGEREKLIRDVAQRPFPCTITVEKVEPTYGYLAEQRFRGGRTLKGHLAGSDIPVTIRIPAEDNEAADRLQPGQRWSTPCVISGWNWLGDHAELLVA